MNKQRSCRSAVSLIFIILLSLTARPASAEPQSVEHNVVRLDITSVTGNAPYVLNGRSVRGRGLLNVLRDANPDGKTILNVYLHSDKFTIRDISQIRATADKHGGFAEQHIFIQCSKMNHPAWCEVLIGEPKLESQ